MTEREVSFIRLTADLFEEYEEHQLGLARRSVDFVEANEHYMEAMKSGASASALRNVLADLGF